MTAPWQPTVVTAPAVGPSLLWFVGVSCWLLPVLLSMGALAWIGFAIIGTLVLRYDWLIASAVYGVAALLISATPLLLFTLREVLAWQIIAQTVLFVVATVHALIANRSWVTTLWGRRERGERMLGPGRPSARTSSPVAGTAVGAPAAARVFDGPVVAPEATLPPTVPGLDVATAEFFTEPTAGSESGSQGATATAHAPVDPRVAPLDELAAIPLIGPDRAAYLIAWRDGVQLDSLADLGALLHLQPHELAALRPHLIFPRPTSGEPRGRVLDV